MRAGALGLAVLMALPAGASGTTPPAGSDETSPAALRSRIQALVGTAACSTDADCRSSAIGAKACGGPEAYIAWSAPVTDASALASALAGYSAAQQAANLREGRVSTCEFVTDPGVACVAKGAAGGTCQLRQRPRGQGGASSR